MEGESVIEDDNEYIADGDENDVSGDDSIGDVVDDNENVVDANENVVDDNENVVDGDENVVDGDENAVEDDDNDVGGDDSVGDVVDDDENVVDGDENVVDDDENVVDDDENVVDGSENAVEDDDNDETVVSGNDNVIDNDDTIEDEQGDALFAQSLSQLSTRRRLVRRNLRRDLRWRIPSYVPDFEDNAREEALVLGQVSVRDLEPLQRHHRSKARNEWKKDVKKHDAKVAGVEDVFRSSRVQMQSDLRESLKDISKKRKKREKRHKERRKLLKKAFNRAGKQLGGIISRRVGEVRKAYGHALYSEPKDMNSDALLRLWRKQRRTIEIRLHSIRTVKDKIPRGKYVVVVSLYERLGGAQLPWRLNVRSGMCPLHPKKYVDNCEICLGKAGGTVPVKHNGGAQDMVLHLGNSLYTTFPPKLPPYMVLVLELVERKRGRANIVVGWSAFPLCGPTMEPIQGKFKTPVLRGGVDGSVSNYTRFETAYRENLDMWLANLYFEVIYVERVWKGRKEHEYRAEMTAELLSLTEKDIDEGGKEEKEMDEDAEEVVESDEDEEEEEGSVAGSSEESEEEETDEEESEENESEETDSIGSVPSDSEVVREVIPGVTYVQHDENDIEVPDMFDGFRKGMIAGHKLQSLSTQAVFKRIAATQAQNLERYSYSLPQPVGYTRVKAAAAKLHYMGRALVADLALSEWRTAEFWMTWILLIFTLWGRAFTHYMGEYLFLKALGIPIYEFDVNILGFDLGYDARQLSVWIEVGVITSGWGLNGCIFLLLALISWLSQKIFGSFFDFGSRFILCVAFAFLLDELLLLIFDLLTGNSNGDAFKLYNYYDFREGAGHLGILVTILLFLALHIIAAFMIYHYILRIHNNGLMHDVYVRTRGAADCFFIPHDMEVTVRELAWVCRKAEAWRGKRGERRKIVVADFETLDPKDPKFLERTTQVAIYTFDAKRRKLKGLYRQFLRLDDGMLLEVSSSLELMGSEEYSALQRALVGNRGGGAQRMLSMNEFVRGGGRTVGNRTLASIRHTESIYSGGSPLSRHGTLSPGNTRIGTLGRGTFSRLSSIRTLFTGESMVGENMRTVASRRVVKGGRSTLGTLFDGDDGNLLQVAPSPASTARGDSSVEMDNLEGIGVGPLDV